MRHLIDRVPFLVTQYRTCKCHRETTAHLKQSWLSISTKDANKLMELDRKNDLLFAQLEEQLSKLSPSDKERFDKLVTDCV